MFAVSRQAIGNRILDALPQAEFGRILEHVTNVHLEKDEVVYAAGDRVRYAYFPIQGLLSLISTTETGSTLELAMFGNEAMVGLGVINKDGIIPYDVTVRFATDALKIKVEVLQEQFNKGGRLQELMLGYIGMLIAQISQSSICHRFHTIEEALSRWLLAVQDRVKSDTLNLTQETISNALGVPRTGVTTAAGSLQREGLIRYSRGKISILDRPGLEAHSCECYRAIRDEVQWFPQSSAVTLMQHHKR
jgi:CRP-like cAMP-binding protein